MITIIGWIVSPILSALIGWLVVAMKQNKKETEALRLGMQALLRDRLIQSYKHSEQKGYIDIDDRENWNNMYNQYHNLGANGVMDNIRQKLLALPTSPNKED